MKRLVIALIIGCVASSATGQSRIAVLDNVVAIDVAEDGVSKGHGYGLIVGKSDNHLWAATAAHLVFKPGWQAVSDPVPFPEIIAHWNSSLGRRLVTRVVPGARTDTAFIEMEAPATAFFGEPVLNSAPLPGEKVAIAAVPNDIRIDSHAGSVPTRASDSMPYAIEGLGGVEGQSGAPVTSDKGIIGLFNAHAAGGRAFVIPIAAVKAAAPSDVPWMLTDSADPDHRPIHFCLRQIGPQKPAISLRGNDITFSPDSSGCATSSPQQLQVMVADNEHFVCDPQFITPKRGQDAPMAIDCDIRIAGTWHSAAGEIFITRTTMDTWTLSGAAASRFGPVSGELHGFAHQNIFNGTNSFGGPLTGSFDAEPRQARFKIQSLDGETQTLELSR